MNTAAENDLTSGQVDSHLIADFIAHCIAKSAALPYVAGQAADAP